jgi:hypothetical protein
MEPTTTETTTQAPIEQPKLYGKELADKLREEREAKRLERINSKN